MATKQQGNIFETLSNDDISDEESQQIQKQKETNQKRIRSKKPKTAEISPQIPEVPLVIKPQIHNSKHPHEIKKDKKVTAEPHPLDKHSGTGRGREMRKGGAGKANWGTMKDDLKPDPTEKKEEGDVEIEEKDENLTLTELLIIKNKRELEKQQKKEKEQKDIDFSGFKKDKCELIEKKKEIDDNKSGSKKTTRINEMHNILGSNDNKELLGLRTGLLTYSEKPRFEGKNDQPERRPKENREPREHNQELKKENKENQKKDKNYEKQVYMKPEERKAGQQTKQNEQKQYQKNESQVNFSDSKSFPTL